MIADALLQHLQQGTQSNNVPASTSITIQIAIALVLLIMHTMNHRWIQYWFDVSNSTKILNICAKQKRDHTQRYDMHVIYLQPEFFMFILC